MNSERYQKICEVFAEADALPAARRAAFLDEVCGGDEELRAEVESLLASDADAGDFIESPALEMAAEMMASDNAQAKVGSQIGHYKVLSLLGAGGMGEVWLAEDTRLKRRIALKLLSVVHKKDLLARFEQEAYAVSALNHPNILTIYDIGQSDGWQFIATEYINGKTLRQLITEKSLTLAESVEIAIQICTALAAAHHAGIIHRDIKPENIMRRADGLVKILDFGLARFGVNHENLNQHGKFVTKPGMIMGTVAYMSPEQARALPIDERTDIFSFGVVLHEMLTGKQPFEGTNEIEVLAAILEREPRKMDNVPLALQNVIARALNKNHLDRPSAEEILDELRAANRKLEYTNEIINKHETDNLHDLQTMQMTAVTENALHSPTGRAPILTSAKSIVRSAPRKFTLAVLGLFLLLSVIGGIVFYRHAAKNSAAPILTEADKLLVAQFANKTGDEEFDNIFRQPLAVGLSQSPFISLVSDGQIRQTLKQMEKPPETPLTYDVAKEISQRRGIKAFLQGSIENHGVKYLITLEAFNAETGASIAREQAESANKETVIDSLDEAINTMREKLGESLASIKRFDAPLKISTTGSLEALKYYSLATKSLSDGKIEDGITFLKQAIEIDPNYASAYASLAAAYSNRGQLSEAADYSAKAFALRDRMTEREKEKITSFYYVFVTGEIEKDIENLEAAKLAYPRDNTIPLNLGASYIELGKFAQAEENARLSIKIDPTIFFPYSNLGKYLSRQSRFEESKAVYQDALNRKFESTQINNGLFTDAFALGDEAEMERQLKLLGDTDDTLKLRGNIAIFGGKAREFEKLMAQAVERTEKDSPDVAADYAGQIATGLAPLGKCAAAETWANRALKIDRGQQTLIDSTLTLAVCGKPVDPYVAELKQRFPKNTVVNSIWLPIITAAAEMRDAPDEALRALEINRQYEGAAYFWDNYLRGKIYARLGQNEQAKAEFEKILRNRGWAVQSPLYALSALELFKIYALQNDSENAKKYSEQFREIWKNADTDLPAMKDFVAQSARVVK